MARTFAAADLGSSSLPVLTEFVRRGRADDICGRCAEQQANHRTGTNSFRAPAAKEAAPCIETRGGDVPIRGSGSLEAAVLQGEPGGFMDPKRRVGLMCGVSFPTPPQFAASIRRLNSPPQFAASIRRINALRIATPRVRTVRFVSMMNPKCENSDCAVRLTCAYCV